MRTTVPGLGIRSGSTGSTGRGQHTGPAVIACRHQARDSVRVRANDPRKVNGRVGRHDHPRAKVRVLVNDHLRVWTGMEVNTDHWGNVRHRTCDQNGMIIDGVVG